jgi:type III secretion system FlhB-like substrate exporter
VDKAVAITYERSLPAPIVVARGRGEMAARIREIAAAHGIALVREPEVAEALVELDVGACIPEEFYEIIARVLVWVSQVDRGAR